MKSSSVQLLQSVVEPLLDNIFVRPPTDHYMTKKNARLKTFIEPLPPKPKTLTLPQKPLFLKCPSILPPLCETIDDSHHTHILYFVGIFTHEACKRGPTHGPCLEELRRSKPLADGDIILHIWEVVPKTPIRPTPIHDDPLDFFVAHYII